MTDPAPDSRKKYPDSGAIFLFSYFMFGSYEYVTEEENKIIKGMPHYLANNCHNYNTYSNIGTYMIR